MFVKHKLNMPSSPYGLWHVTTEGDCEGRTTNDLGIHEGWIDEIAERLSGKCFYTLDFAPVVPEGKAPVSPVRPSVCVSLPIGTGTWDLSSAERVKAFANWLKSRGRKVTVTEGQYYASVELTFNEEKQKESKRLAALEKLTAEEKALLGLDK